VAIEPFWCVLVGVPAGAVVDDVTDVAYWRERAVLAEGRLAVAEERLAGAEARVSELSEQVAVLSRTSRPGHPGEPRPGSEPTAPTSVVPRNPGFRILGVMKNSS
jgi:hypothetical protein